MAEQKDKMAVEAEDAMPTTDVSEAKNKVQTINPNNILHLSKPLRNGDEELIFDWDKITGYNLIACERAAKKKDPSIMVPSLSQSYQAMVAGLAANVRYDDICGMGAKDFSAACLMAQNFLLGNAET